MEGGNKYIVHRCPGCGSDEVKDLEKEYYEFEGTGGFFKALGRWAFDSKPAHKYRCDSCGKEWDKENLVDETPVEVLEERRQSEIAATKSNYHWHLFFGAGLLAIAVVTFRYCWNNEFRYYEKVDGWFNTGPVDVAYYHWSWLFVGLIFVITAIWGVVNIVKAMGDKDHLKVLKSKTAEDLRWKGCR